ncbi:MAG: DUF6531 domain-containing protein [Oscillospiraceae bacterium]|jgi:RHS repeat-associated protein|nr:DUF6531 domain-containing protein [Oscillospiraceae bacterium]
MGTQIKAVYNEQAILNLKTETEKTINEQVEAMTKTKNECIDRAGELDQQAAEQERLAITLTKSVTKYDEEGNPYTVWVADTVGRNVAATKAKELHKQAQEKRDEAKILEDSIKSLQDALRETNDYLDSLLTIIRRTDLTYAEKIKLLNEETQKYVDKMGKIGESFNDTFPFENNPLETLQDLAIDATGLGAELKEKLKGQAKAAGLGGDPINLTTGNYLYYKEDIIIPGSFSLAFKRFYNALDNSKGILGENWTHNFNMFLEEKDDRVRITFDDGHVEIYQKIDDDTYVSPLVSDYLLQKTDKGFSITSNSKSQYIFDCNGQLIIIIDRNGNEIELLYSKGLLSKVQNPCGKLSFEYDSHQHLIRIVDHTGRQVKFEYNDNYLIKVIHPNGSVFGYEYNDIGRISKVINPLGIVMIQNEYDQHYRATKQQYPDGGLYSLSYDDNTKITTVIEQNGNKVKYLRDEKYRTIKNIYSDSEERFEYSDSNNHTLYVDRNGNAYKYEYDKLDNLVKSIDPLGVETLLSYSGSNVASITREGRLISSLKYDTNGNMIESKDGIGRLSQYKYDKSGLMVQAINPDNGELSLKYDSRGNIIMATNAEGGITKFKYNNLNQIIEVVQPEGNTTQFSYDLSGNISQVTNAEGNSKYYTYNKNGNVTRIVDWDGSSINYSYNNIGKPSEIVDQVGGITKYEYDKMWNIIKKTDPNGAETHIEYDEFIRVKCVTDPEGYKTYFNYDKNGNTVSVTDPDGAVTQYEYDPLNRKITEIDAKGATTRFVYDEFNNLVQIRDPLGGVYLSEYDEAAQLISKTDPLGRCSRFAYNELGLIKSETKADGTTTYYEHNKLGAITKVINPEGAIERYKYDKNGRVTTYIDTLGAKSLYKYDSLDRVITVVNALGQSKKFEYDAMNNITKAIDENGNATQYRYSPKGNLIEVIDAMGGKISYSYDKASQLSKLEQLQIIDKKLVNIQETRYSYNKRGDVTSVINPLGIETKYTYNGNGRMITKTDGDGILTKYDYDPVGQLTQIQYADGRDVRMSYSPLRQLEEIHDWLGTTRIKQDALGRSQSITNPNGETIAHQWNALDKRVMTTYPDGSTVKYIYNKLGMVSGVESSLGKVEYEYDNLGRLTQKVLPNNVISNYEYDPLGRLESLIHKQGRQVLDQYAYQYDKVGNISQIRKNRQGIDLDTGVFKYGYDLLGRLISTEHGRDRKIFSYDSLGNQIGAMHNKQRTARTFNAMNQLVSSHDIDGISEYSYDGRGNLTKVLQNGKIAEEYIFDSANKLVQATIAGRGVVNYIYNGLNKRIGLTELPRVPDPLKKDVHFIDDLTIPFNNLLSSDNRKYIWGGLDLIGSISDENNAFYLCDRQGSPVRIMYQDGTTETMAYDEFGKSLQDGPEWNIFGFTGYQMDKINNLLFAGNRFYDSAISRFNSQDPHWNQSNSIYGDLIVIMPGTLAPMPDIWAIQQNSNKYAYCINNPHKYIDKNSEWLNILIGAVAGAVIGAAGNVITAVVTGEEINWKKVAVNAATGAASGALMSCGIPVGYVMLGNAAIDMAGNAIEQGIDMSEGNQDEFNCGEMFFEGAVSAVTTFFLYDPGINKHLLSESQRLLKQLANGKPFKKAWKYFISQTLTETKRSFGNAISKQELFIETMKNLFNWFVEDKYCLV